MLRGVAETVGDDGWLVQGWVGDAPTLDRPSGLGALLSGPVLPFLQTGGGGGDELVLAVAPEVEEGEGGQGRGDHAGEEEEEDPHGEAGRQVAGIPAVGRHVDHRPADVPRLRGADVDADDVAGPLRQGEEGREEAAEALAEEEAGHVEGLEGGQEGDEGHGGGAVHEGQEEAEGQQRHAPLLPRHLRRALPQESQQERGAQAHQHDGVGRHLVQGQLGHGGLGQAIGDDEEDDGADVGHLNPERSDCWFVLVIAPGQAG